MGRFLIHLCQNGGGVYSSFSLFLLSQALSTYFLQQGDSITTKKSAGTVSDQSFIDYTYYPLIPSIQSTVQNPSNLVEEAAAEGWIRGGLPSRDIQRDTQYFNAHKQ